MKYFVGCLFLLIFVPIVYAQEVQNISRTNLFGVRASIDVQSTGFGLGFKWWLAERNSLLIGINADDIYLTGLYNYVSQADKPHIATTLNIFAQYEFHFKPIKIEKTDILPFVAVTGYFGSGNDEFPNEWSGTNLSAQGAIGLECFLSSKFSIGVQQGLLFSYRNLLSSRNPAVVKWDVQSRCSILAHLYF